jgi:DNA polymerase elongation subunit (family B)
MNYKFICYSFGSLDDEKYLTPDVRFTDIEFDIWAPDPNDKRKNPEKIKIGIRVCRYTQQANDEKGSLPDILSKLLAARKSKRKEAEKETDPFRKALLDAEQLAYKLTANSLYGQLGSATFKIRLQHLAASTTAYGRKQILFAKDAIETFYGADAKDPRCVAMTVYGDTDSLFINFNVKDPVTGEKLTGRRAIEETMKLTEEAGKFVTRCLKKPHDFEYDKVFYPFIIFSKKRYVGNKYEESSDNYKQTSMGIATKRRDYAAIVKNVYGGAIHTLLNEKDPVKAFHFVQKTCNELVDGKLSSHQITLSKSLRSEYKATTPPPHKILAERIKARDPGNAPASGDRLEFMYIIPDNPQTKLQGDRVETPSFIKENKLKIDYKYYIEHQIYNPITQLFGLFVEQLPGFVKSSKQLTADEKEVVAGELLFNDIYKRCDKENNRLQTKKFADRFGFTMKETPQVVEKSRVVKNIVSTIQMKQSTLNFSKLDSYLNSVDKKKKK